MDISLLTVAKILASLHLSYILLQCLLPCMYAIFIAPCFKPNFDIRTLTGKWAAVTGSTDGIGKAIAKKLAEYGINIVLISRSQEKLKKTAKLIESEYHVKTKTIAVDFSMESELISPVIKKGLEDMEIEILVNNAAEFYRYPEYLYKYPNAEGFIKSQINVNMISYAMMLQLLLPQMVERRKGIIVNISSMISLNCALPLVSIYAATKSFVDRLAKTLYAEYKDHGITFLTIKPGYVATKMSRQTEPSLFCIKPEILAENAINQISLRRFSFGSLIFEIVAGVRAILFQFGCKYLVELCLFFFFRRLRNIYLKRKFKYAKKSNTYVN